MTEGGARRFCVGIAVACAAALAAACGNYHPNHIEFRFTPIPVTALPSGTPVSLDAKCNVFVADEVLVAFDTPQLAHLKRWMDDIGFTVREHGEPPVFLTIGVPPGSVPDAIALIAKQPGVLYAERNTDSASVQLPTADGPPPGEFYFRCRAPR